MENNVMKWRKNKLDKNTTLKTKTERDGNEMMTIATITKASSAEVTDCQLYKDS